MDNRITTFLSVWMLFLICIGCVCNIVYTIHQPIWSPRDEIGHYDYIDRLSSFELPSPSDDISDYTFEITMQNFTWIKPDGFDQTKAGMGLAGKSYEAQHPPVYYTALALPNRLIKLTGVSPTAHIRLLRVLQIFFMISGILVLIPIFKELQALFGIDSFFGLFLSLCILLTNTDYYYSLGNDNLSMLVCNIAVLFYLVAWRKDKSVYAFAAAFFTALCFLVKYTNGLMFIPHGIYCAMLLRRRKSVSCRLIITFLLPFLIVGLYMIFNCMVRGKDDVLGTGITKGYFSWWVLPIDGYVKFLDYFIVDSINLKHIGIGRVRSLLWLTPLMMGVNMMFALYMIAKKRNAGFAWLILLCVLISALVILSALILNRYRPGVHWHIFRHYYGYLAFWWMSMIGFFALISKYGVLKNRYFLTVLATGITILYLRCFC